ncbi:MAG: aminotransferase class I/II-fold pyridoxal phosphate-dependent enzyme [Thalassobaculaceae bacterium]
MLNPDTAPLGEYTFARLNDMLAGISPRSNDRPILFSLGEPQNSVPDLLSETLARHSNLWNRYPPPMGDDNFRQAASGWLARRYSLPVNLIDPDKHIIPVPGTREPLYQIGFICSPKKKNGVRSAILMPNPFYHVYQGAAMSAGAEPIYLPAQENNNFFPDLNTISEDVLNRTVIFFLCTPSNPQGSAASLKYLKDAITLARRYDFVLALDECYCEIYRGIPPAGGIEACAELGEGLSNVISFNSLSKRSSAPGLRSGFMVGDEEIIKRYGQFVTFGGSPLPLPILHASTALWNDDDHVVKNRSYYAKNFEIAEEILKPYNDCLVPEAGFFLWLNVGDGAVAAKKLWKENAIKTVPGELMARADPGDENPGKRYLRLALVYDAQTTRFGLEQVVKTLCMQSSGF